MHDINSECDVNSQTKTSGEREKIERIRNLKRKERNSAREKEKKMNGRKEFKLRELEFQT